MKPGIRIKYVQRTGSQGNTRIAAQFYVDKGTPSKNFISTIEIRRAIEEGLEKNKVKLGQFIGHMTIIFKRNSNTARWYLYYPFSNTGGEFRGKGIAQVLELRVLAGIKKRFPSLERWVHIKPNPARKRQLEKRGIKPPFEYHHEEGVRKLKEKIKKDVGKYRNIKKPR